MWLWPAISVCIRAGLIFMGLRLCLAVSANEIFFLGNRRTTCEFEWHERALWIVNSECLTKERILNKMYDYTFNLDSLTGISI